MNPETRELESLRGEISEDTSKKFAKKMEEAEAVIREELRKKKSRRSHWALFNEGEILELKGYPFRITRIKESGLVLKAVPPKDPPKESDEAPPESD